jgi:dihydrofolate reductase
MSSLKLSLIVAMNNSNRGIGVNGTIPWRLPKDLKHFARVTTFTSTPGKQNAVIMGKNTWQSIPKQYRPLPNRLNVVISTKLQPDTLDPGVLVFKSFEVINLYNFI